MMQTPLTTPVFHILLSLVEGGAMHGYAIIQDVALRTQGEVCLTASTLYAAVQRLVDAGIITEVDGAAESGGAPRRSYRITAAGKKLAQSEAERLDRTVAMARAKRLLPRKA
jgi:DNA-binding PadR family transcriptional regulator